MAPVQAAGAAMDRYYPYVIGEQSQPWNSLPPHHDLTVNALFGLRVVVVQYHSSSKRLEGQLAVSC